VRQDFVPLKPGYYLFVVRFTAEGYEDVLERKFRLHWPGRGLEEDIRLTEIMEDSVGAEQHRYQTLNHATQEVIQALDAAIVRIWAADGSVVGAGVLVGERSVLTCAHVIDDALGREQDTLEVPQEGVALDFPLVAPGQKLTARVTAWQPDADVAALELTEPPPAGAAPVVPVSASDLWGHSFRAFGFPAGHSDDGVWSPGRILGRNAFGWVQIESIEDTSYFVKPGFSGGPVWDEMSGAVVGIVVASERQPDVGAAFCIPADALKEAWPELTVSQQNAPPTKPVPSPAADTSALRTHLQRLDDVQIESLCLDHFPDVYDKFSRGLQRGEKINLLLDHCRRNPEDAARLAVLLKRGE
jgi:S1-C subfamily serine protease